MTAIPVKDASAEAIVAYARDVMNLEVDPTASKAQALAALSQAGVDIATQTIDPPRRRKAAPQIEAAAPGGVIEEGSLADLKVTIMIPEVEGEAEMVAVSSNGRAMYIPRGQECSIPYPFYAVLREARRTVWSSDLESGLTSKREVAAIPVQVFDMPERVRAFEAQQAAWRRSAA